MRICDILNIISHHKKNYINKERYNELIMKNHLNLSMKYI